LKTKNQGKSWNSKTIKNTLGTIFFSLQNSEEMPTKCKVNLTPSKVIKMLSWIGAILKQQRG